MAPKTVDGQTISLTEAVKQNPKWAATRIRFLEHVLKTMNTLIESGLFSIETVDDLEFKPEKETETAKKEKD